MLLTNEKVKSYEFLRDMVEDSYFPSQLVDKGKAILLDLCQEIEAKSPRSLAELYVLTHAATERFNRLDKEFWENGSEIETVARESIGADFAFIASAYNFEADVEELIATREW